MKKFLTFIIFLLIVCTACSNSDSSEEQNFNISEALKIKTWLLDEELEGKGHWGYIDPSTRTTPHEDDGNGYWIPNDGEAEVANDDVFVYEELEVGVPRTMAPMSMHMFREKGSYIGYSNLNIEIDFEGFVEVEKIEPNDSSIRLMFSYSDNGSSPIAADSIKVNSPTIINLCPVGKITYTEGAGGLLITTDTLVDKEYTIQIRTYFDDGSPAVTAELKLTSIPDPEYPWQTVHEGHYGEMYKTNEKRTRFCKIELLSYSYSDMYIIKGEAGNAE